MAVQAAAGLETVVAVAGALIAGVAVVPIPPDSGPLERQHIIADSKAELILGEGPTDSSIPLIPIDIHARSATSYPEPSAAATALIMYTSGTTGAPKGVVLSRASIAADLDALAHVWNWTPEDTLVHGLPPLFHVHGLILGVLGALRVGSPLIHTVRPTPDSYAAAGGSLYFGVPTVWSRVCGDPSAAAALRSARLLVSGSAPLPVPLFERMKSLTGLAPVERYGMSETLITVSTTHDGERRPGWVGHAVPGVRTRLRGENGELSAHDGEQLGQLEVAGAVLFDEYLGNPSKTAESMTEDGWFRTGDIAVIDDSGFHRIVGRESVDMIKSGGYRIGAGEVEQALLAYPRRSRGRRRRYAGRRSRPAHSRLHRRGGRSRLRCGFGLRRRITVDPQAPTPGLSGGQLAPPQRYGQSPEEAADALKVCLFHSKRARSLPGDHDDGISHPIVEAAYVPCATDRNDDRDRNSDCYQRTENARDTAQRHRIQHADELVTTTEHGQRRNSRSEVHGGDHECIPFEGLRQGRTRTSYRANAYSEGEFAQGYPRMPTLPIRSTRSNRSRSAGQSDPNLSGRNRSRIRFRASRWRSFRRRPTQLREWQNR